MSAPSGAVKKLPIHLQSSQHRIVIKGGRVVNHDSVQDADVYIENGTIAQVGPNLIVPGGCRVVEARGCYVLPGGIDPHTHLNEVFMGAKTADDFYTGTRAALAGGTTTIINHIMGTSDGLVEAFDKYQQLASDKSCCDYSFHVAVTKFNEGSTEQEMETLVNDRGISSFKMFMAYKGSYQLSDSKMIKVFDVCKRIGAIPLVHAENGDVIDYLQHKLLKQGVTGPEGHLQSRPESAEAEATKRAILMAETVNSPLYVVHVMSKSAADEVHRGRARGNVIIGETLAAALATDGSNVNHRCWRHAAGYVMSPPLRDDPTTQSYLMNLLGSGTLETTGSDHCTFSTAEKNLGQKNFTQIPNGVNGLEERMTLIWEKGVKPGKLTPCQFVAVTSSNAARCFNMYPRKGRVQAGSDADIVVMGRNPKVISSKTHHSAVDFNIFEGVATEFNPIVVIAGGRIVLDEEGKLHMIQGCGQFIPCKPFSPFVYPRVLNKDLNVKPTKVDRSKVDPPARSEKIVDPIKTHAAGGDSNGTGHHHNQHQHQHSHALPAGAPNVKNLDSPLTLVTDLDGLRVGSGDGGPSSPRSSGSLTPTGFHQTATRSGVRNQQDSSFKLDGKQIDDDKGSRTSVKLHQPPGGKSHGLW